VPGRREVTGRELALLVCGAIALVVAMEWPLVLHLGTTIPHDRGDPLAESWEIAWGGHALAHQPLDFFGANQFWPFRDTLAFSDALVGYAPAGLLGSGPEAAVARYDLVFLFAYVLAFLGGYLLARELGAGPGGAAVAGAAFAFAPYRLEQNGHMQVISSGGIPLALAVALRGYRRRRSGWVIAGWLVATWQLSLSWTLGLPFAYLLAALCLIALVAWLRRARPKLPRPMAVATAVGIAAFLLAAALLARPYLHVQHAHPQAHRSPETVAAFSGPPWIYLVAPDGNLVWGDATAGLRSELTQVPEKTLFPGLSIVALAVAGLGWAGYARGLRRGLGIGVLAFAALALGFRMSGGLLWPDRIAYELLPGWQGIRTPGRLTTFVSLGLALLAAAGAERAIAAAARRSARRLAPAALAAALAAAVVIEGLGLPFMTIGERQQPSVPDPPPSTASVPAPQLHLPALRDTDNRRYLLWSTDGFPRMVNGKSSIEPAFTKRLIRRMRGFPSPRTVAILRRLGVRSVIVHLDRVRGTPWRRVLARPARGLGLVARRDGPLEIYELRSPAGSGSSSTLGSASAGSL